MNEYSNKWWFWGIAGAVVLPVVLLAVDRLTQPMQGTEWHPYIYALCVAIGGGVGMISVPALPVLPWVRLVLFFVYIPVFIYSLMTFTPWAMPG